MMQQADLVLHPAAQCRAVQRIAVVARRDAGALSLSYRLEGDMTKLRLPPAAGTLRADSLWQHSCFEAFLRADGNDIYYEFNFAPSGHWAAYRFSARRRGGSAPSVAAPTIDCRGDAESFAMTVQLGLADIPELAGDGALDLGLTAVIEDTRCRLSHWALAHGAAQPDFHDPATFLMRLDAR